MVTPYSTLSGPRALLGITASSPATISPVDAIVERCVLFRHYHTNAHSNISDIHKHIIMTWPSSRSSSCQYGQPTLSASPTNTSHVPVTSQIAHPKCVEMRAYLPDGTTASRQHSACSRSPDRYSSSPPKTRHQSTSQHTGPAEST